MHNIEARSNSFSHQHEQQAPRLTIGIAPVIFSQDFVEIGCLNPEEHGSIEELRSKHEQTHAFRFDSRDNTIVNIGLKPGLAPMGESKQIEVREHLWLFAIAITQQLRLWFSKNYDILNPFRPLICLGSLDRLLTKTLREFGVQQPDPRLDIFARWSFDFRVLSSADSEVRPYLGLIADFNTTNVINIPVIELLEKNFDPVGYYVRTSGEIKNTTRFSRPPLLGRIKKVENKVLLLDDVRSDFKSDHVSAADVFLEPRNEVLEAVTKALYPNLADRAMRKMRTRKGEYISGRGKMEKVRRTIAALNRSSHNVGEGTLNLRFNNGLNVSFGKLLDQSSAWFPSLVETRRPTMLFGAGGYNQYNQPDSGIRKHGPFQYTQNPKNEPTVVVLCQKVARGRMEQFVKALRDGIEQNNGRFSGGLVGKFRLTNVRFRFVEIGNDTGEEYAAAASSALDGLTRTPELALVQVREAHKQIPSARNPYFVAKSRFMRSGVPVQAVRLETIEENYGRTYKLNNLALGSYAKIGGIPWVISTRGVATHELVIGIGATEIGGSRLGDRARYVGITTLFQGDGRYLVWETTEEATYEDYPRALLKSLQKSIRFVQIQNRWKIGENVRLVFHVYKPLKRVEIRTVKQLVEELLTDYPVEFAFLDVSRNHPFQIFDPSQSGITYGSYRTRKSSQKKGVFVPERGTAILLGPRSALLQLVGSREVKHRGQGIPRPLLLELHQDSDFSDLTYLVRQAFHFSFMSWRSFFPAYEPVTILYSRWIANMLGNLRAVPDWDRAALNLMRDRRAMWFL